MKMLINGNWCGENNPQLEVRRSFDGRVIDTVPRADADDIENALTAATDAARVMAKLPAHARMAALNRAADKMDGEVEALAKIISDETSKPITEARGEAIRMSAMLRLSAYEGAHLRGETLSLDALPIPPAEDKMGFTLRVPRGVIVAITPFNYPALLVMHKIAPALATGNAVILKPTSATPLSALKICEIIAGSGFPEHALQCVTGGGNEIGDWLISDDRVHKISFTGSAAIGAHIASRAGVKPLSLELGSNCPCIVLPDADMKQVADLSAVGGYVNAGQVCLSLQRVLVQREIYDDYLAATAAAVEKITIGAPHDEDTKLSAMINENEAKRVFDWVHEAAADGARVITGGDRDGAILSPTLVADVKPEMRLFRDEVFGPVMGVMPVADLDEALHLCEVGGYGLAASLFTRDIGVAMRFIRTVRTGNAHINWTPLWRNDLMPYGGVGKSGYGKEGIRSAVHEMTEEKNAVIHGIPT
jgi:glyceraldehyde-3-phosphate dehydrogenase (NADP+)